MCPPPFLAAVTGGGTVSSSSQGRPSRVWANGRIGLAMSRSIGDGECKLVGVIPDPEIVQVKPAEGSTTPCRNHTPYSRRDHGVITACSKGNHGVITA